MHPVIEVPGTHWEPDVGSLLQRRSQVVERLVHHEVKRLQMGGLLGSPWSYQ